MATNKSTISLFLSLLFFSSAILSLALHDLRLDEFEDQHHGGGGGWEPEGGAEGAETNPYHFGRRSFRTLFRSSEGIARILPRFTKRSRWLFRGIGNHRFAFMEMAPNTFAVPHHNDADFVFLVLRGRGVVTFVSQDTKESFHIEKGHVVRIPAGTTHYITNTDNNRLLRIAKIIVPVYIPGWFENFFIAGSENQHSYFRGFSSEVLTASFNVSEEQLERVFRGRRQRHRIMRTASPEQIKELSRHAISPKSKREGRRWGSFDLHSQEPIYSNEFGRFYEAHPDKFKQLEDLGISVTCINMTEGSIFVPHYSTEATMVVFVESGCGRFEMACPHISMQQWQQQRKWRGRRQWGEETEEEEEEEEMSGEIHKIVSDVCEGEVFIIPAGHPVALVARDQNFVAVGFGINAENNQRNFLAGQKNILSKLEREAKRLTFGAEEEEVAEKVFESQDKSYFVPARHSRREAQRREKGRHSFQSIFDVFGY